METVLHVPVPSIDGADLTERFRAGDEEAFEVIVTRHRRAVYLMALRLLGRHEDADEADDNDDEPEKNRNRQNHRQADLQSRCR